MSRSFPCFWVGLSLLAAAFAAPFQAAYAEDALQPGEAFVTRFSGSKDDGGKTVIDLAGTVGSILDLRKPGVPPLGAQWLNEPQRSAVTAGEVGQVFGIALDDANPPNIYLTATSAFGLHRDPVDAAKWMEGMWGLGGGPGSVWKLDAASGYKPSAFAQIKLDGRDNSGAALGNIAFDPWNKQFFVSNLETGMIHRLRAANGSDLGHYDHGVTGRASFVDAASGAAAALPAVAFDPATSAHTGDCPSGDFARTPSCWNFADFRRRVWGLGARRDPSNGEVRLYYSVWGSQGFGSADYAAAGEDQRNSVWSVRIGSDGNFDTSSVRREFFLPDFFRSPEAIARAGRSHPVTDIVFPALSDQPVMVVAERGGVRNLGLAAENSFATPDEARVLRYELDDKGVWQPVGRYDVGFYDRKDEGPPYIRAGSSGGAAFGLGYGESWEADLTRPDAFLWMTGDALCSPKGPCLDTAAKTHTDVTEVHGVMGREANAFDAIVPEAAFQPYPAPGPSYPAAGPDRSFMIDIDAGEAAPAPNDATRIGDIAIYEPAAKTPDLKIAKSALAQRCEPGKECTFEIVVENVGTLAYEGPLTIHDVADGTAKLIQSAPPDWTCKEFFGGNYECSHPQLSLGAGEKISLALTVEVPSWWTRPVYSNCAELTVPGGAEDEHAYNNSSCDYVPTVDPTPYGPDLEVKKFRFDHQCDWLGDCYFVIRVTNVGPAYYSGPLHVRDRVTQASSTFNDWTPQPEWTCEPVGVGGEFDCKHDPVTLTPGDYRELTVKIHAPPIVAGHTHIRNCAWFAWDGAKRDYNPGNEYDCSIMSRFPPGFPGAVPYMEISKKAVPTCSRPGGPGTDWQCAFFVTITNTGGAPYFDPVELNDLASNLPATLALALDPPWACVDGGGGNVTCQYPAVPGGLLPGDDINLFLVFTVPAAVVPPNWLQNCGMIRWDNDGDGVGEEIESCAVALVCDAGSANCPKDLAILKFTSPDPCFPGGPCDFAIDVQNISDTPFAGPLVITDTPDIGLGVPIVNPPTWSCIPAGAAYTCTNPAPLAPGAFDFFTLSFPVPADYTLPTVKNCARLEIGPPNNVIPINDESCAIGFVPFPDLAPFGGTECKRGESCTLDVRIDNKGKLPFLGSAGLKGTLSPAVKIASIESATAGFSCKVTGNGAYECKGAQLNIPPGGGASVEIVIDVPADFAQDTIAHIKEMIWPDREVKDKNSGNDRHDSTITIVGAKPALPTCTGGAVVDGKCECPAGYAPKQTGADAYICEKLPPTLTCAGGAVVDGECQCPAGYQPKQTGADAFNCEKLPPTLTCLGGTVKNGECTCPAGSKPKLIGTNAYRCEPVITCAGGTVKNNACVCPEGSAPKLVGTNSYRCEPVISCTGGAVKNDKCVCPEGYEPKQTGPNAYRCVPAITCKGGTVKNDQCVCPEGFEPKQTGPNAYRCVPIIICVDGRVKNGECVCAKGSEAKQTGPNAYRCVPVITCKGGTVKNGECVCPEGTEPKVTGPNAYRCVPIITCRGGTVKDGKCLCPEGKTVKQTGPNAFACIDVPPPITCSGGKVDDGKCVCPDGMEPKPAGPNAFRCVPKAPKITCTGGAVLLDKCVCPTGTVLKQTGKNAFACVKVPGRPPLDGPLLACSGGKIEKGRCTCPKGSIMTTAGKNQFVCKTPGLVR